MSDALKKIIEWVKANPYKVAVIALAVACVLLGGLGYSCGYIKGCSSAKSEAVK